MEESSTPTGIGALSRGRATDGQPPGAVPPPRFRWVTRLAVPGGILLIAGILFLSAAWRSLIPATHVTALPVVERAAHEAAAGTEVFQAAGWIEANPHLTHVSALTEGVIEEIFALEGDRVEAGQVIARLVDEDARLALQAAEAAVADRRAAVAEAQARLNQARTDWDNPVERRRASAVAEAALHESRSALNELEAQITAAAADAERLRLEHGRFVQLRATQTISDSEYTDARGAWESHEAQLEALRRRREVIRAQIARQEAELAAATDNERLRTAERQALESAQANLARAEAGLQAALVARDEAQLRVERLEVHSPISGVVVERHCEPGMQVLIGADDRLSAAIVSLYDPRHIQVRVDVPLADAGLVAEGQSAEVRVDALPDTAFQGTVTRILHLADIQKNTLQVKVAIADPSPLLRPEMLARVRFLAPEREADPAGSALFAPAAAVRDGAAWIVEQFDGTRGIARRRSVGRTGAEHGGWIRIGDGLRPGDLVISPIPPHLDEGQRVAVTLAES